MLESPLPPLTSKYHGNADLLFTVNPVHNLCASTGTTKVVQIFSASNLDRSTNSNTNSNIVAQLIPSGTGEVNKMAWDPRGDYLAFWAIGKTNGVEIWERASNRQTVVEFKGVVSYLGFSSDSKYLAIGSNQAKLTLIDMSGSGTEQRLVLANNINNSRKSKFGNVVSVTFSNSGTVVWAGDNGGLFLHRLGLPGIVDLGGTGAKIVGGLSFGKSQSSEMVAGDMDRKHLMLFNSTYDKGKPGGDRDALNLSFAEEYGALVKFQWLSDGTIIAGFKNGFIVVLTTMDVRVEQFCKQFLTDDDQLVDLDYNNETQSLAICSSNAILIIDPKSWKENKRVVNHPITKIRWLNNLLCVSQANGCLRFFRVRVTNENDKVIREAKRFFREFDQRITGTIVVILCTFVYSYLFLLKRWDPRI